MYHLQVPSTQHLSHYAAPTQLCPKEPPSKRLDDATEAIDNHERRSIVIADFCSPFRATLIVQPEQVLEVRVNLAALELDINFLVRYVAVPDPERLHGRHEVTDDEAKFILFPVDGTCLRAYLAADPQDAWFLAVLSVDDYAVSIHQREAIDAVPALARDAQKACSRRCSILMSALLHVSTGKTGVRTSLRTLAFLDGPVVFALVVLRFAMMMEAGRCQRKGWI